ncbi:MAG: DUF1801 domain-containing protein [Absicoccus sp.]|uniref:iron chaperone n=1 Tax=Absicoccus sp. TaxID=2718527 RepID=UPI002A7523DE|nr:DUF1801 domain-containing protein [Absicoccus sp.]MDY3035565.1 DUF1801 domain-containing protein [Absicoccus sp.]
MWKCPKCGREFSKKNPSHTCGKKPKTVDEYILGWDEPIQKHLSIVRNCLKEALPDATEKISWGMPTYWNQHNIIHFAANKKHIGLYPGSEAVLHFADKLDTYGYAYGKGSIQIPYEEIHCDLIKELAIWCYERRNPV